MPIDRFRGGNPSARDKLNQLVEGANSLSQLRGDEVFIAVRRGPGGACVALNIDAVLSRVPKLRHGADRFWAKITGSAAADSPAQGRWVYAWTEVEKTAAGYGGWTAVDGGRSGTTGTDPAYNSIEDANDGTGVQGNGVDVDGADYPAGFAQQPAPANIIVEMVVVSLVVEDVPLTEYWFTYEGADDGTCEAA
jgi:hypothetical protein